jgi:hypothetical protein
LVKYAQIEKLLVIVFFVLIAVAVCSIFLFNMPGTASILLLVNFVVAGLVAIFASLRLREEEEEKLVE